MSFLQAYLDLHSLNKILYSVGHMLFERPSQLELLVVN